MVKPVGELFRDVAFIFKFVQTICCFISVILLCFTDFTADGTTDDLRARLVTELAAFSYLIICGALLVVYIFGDSFELYELIVLFVGFMLNIGGGLLCLLHFFKNTRLVRVLVIGVFEIGCGVVMIFDWIGLVKNQ